MRLFGTIDNTISNSEKVNIVCPPFNLLTGSCSILGIAQITATGRTQSSAILGAVAKVTTSGKIAWKAVASISSQSKITVTAKVSRGLTSIIKGSSSVIAPAKVNHPIAVTMKSVIVISASGKVFYKQTANITGRSSVVAPVRIIRFGNTSILAIAKITVVGKIAWRGNSSLKGIVSVPASAKQAIQAIDSINSVAKITVNGSVGVLANLKAIANVTATNKMTWGGNTFLKGTCVASAFGKVTNGSTANITSVAKIAVSSKVIKTAIILPITAKASSTCVAKVDHKATALEKSITWVVVSTSSNAWLATANLTSRSTFTVSAFVNRLVSSIQQCSSLSAMTAVGKRSVPLSGSYNINNILTATGKYFIRNPGSPIKAVTRFSAHGDPNGRAIISARSTVTAPVKIIHPAIMPVLSANAVFTTKAKMTWRSVVPLKGVTTFVGVAKTSMLATAQSFTIVGNSMVTATARVGYTFATLRSIAQVTVTGKIVSAGTTADFNGKSSLSASAKVGYVASADIKSISRIVLPGRLVLGIYSVKISKSWSISGYEIVGMTFGRITCNTKFLAWTSSYAYATLTSNSTLSAQAVRFTVRRPISDGNKTFCNPCPSIAFTFKRDGKRYIKNVVNGALAPTLHHLGVSHDISD